MVRRSLRLPETGPKRMIGVQCAIGRGVAEAWLACQGRHGQPVGRAGCVVIEDLEHVFLRKGWRVVPRFA